jgi:amidophosphoribosyltransferase
MAGIFGAISEKGNCIDDVFLGVFYLQDRAQDYCGIAWKNGDGKLKNSSHKGLLDLNYKDSLEGMDSNSAVGVVSTNREPVSGLSNKGGLILCYDGNLQNHNEIKNKLLKNKESFSGFQNPEEIEDGVLISKIITKENSFEKGIERLVQEMQGDFSLIALTQEGIYGARGWGRKPLILGRNEKENSYALSSESVSFLNNGFEIYRDVEPGEIVFLNEKGIHTAQKLDLNPIQYGTFEWIYTANPASIIEGKSVELVRNSIGKSLAKKVKNLDIDIVSPVPDSGRCYATGVASELAKTSKIDYLEVFKKFSYCGRSFTPLSLEEQKKKANRKLIPIKEIIQGKKILLVDDSIVKGNQTREHTKKLKELGAKAVYAAIACPPIKSSCNYGKSIQKDEDCLAKVMDINEIKKTRGLDELIYANVKDLEKAIGISKDKLCLECWGY